MPAAHFLGLRPRLVFAQYPDDLLLAEATPFHRPSPFSGDGLSLISAEFSGCRPAYRLMVSKMNRPAQRRQAERPTEPRCCQAKGAPNLARRDSFSIRPEVSNG